MDEDQFKLTVTWTPRLEGEQAYIAEKIGKDGFVTEYGPMSPDIVKPLINELRASVQKQFEAVRDRFLQSAPARAHQHPEREAGEKQ